MEAFCKGVRGPKGANIQQKGLVGMPGEDRCLTWNPNEQVQVAHTLMVEVYEPFSAEESDAICESYVPNTD